jgi:hypothetical protein
MSKTSLYGKNKKDVKEEVKEDPKEIISYGKFEFQNKILYIGSFKQLTTGVKIREGKGKVIHPSNDNTEVGQETYEGDWSNDKMEGYGIYRYSNGDIFDGEWKDNQQNGFGKYFFTDGSHYEGEWKDHRMHGTGKFFDINGVCWLGEFRDGLYISKEQARLKEEKRVQKKIAKLKEIPQYFFKIWDDVIVKVDKKNAKDLLSPFFAKLENMGLHMMVGKEGFPKLEDKTPEKWNEALKFVRANIVNVHIPINNKDTILIPSGNLVAEQLTEDLSSGQVVEIHAALDLKKANLVLAYSRETDKWLIALYNEIVEKPVSRK